MNGVRKAKVSDLIQDTANANKGTERGQSMLEESLRKRGAGRSVLIDSKGRLIAGNKTTQKALEIGIEDAIIVQSDGKKLIVVQRTDLDLDTDPDARLLAYEDNRIGQADLEFDFDRLQQDIANGVDLSGLWTEKELQAMFGAEGAPKPLDGSSQLGDLAYRVVVDCDSEDHQAAMIYELEKRGLVCRALIS